MQARSSSERNRIPREIELREKSSFEKDRVPRKIEFRERILEKSYLLNGIVNSLWGSISGPSFSCLFSDFSATRTTTTRSTPLVLRVSSPTECATALDGDDELEGDELLPDNAQHHAQPPLQPGPARVPA